MSTVLIVDDSDPAITYTGNWATLLSSVGAQTNEYTATVHQSSTAGDQLSYTFDGTGIAVYGTLNAPGIYGPPNASFSIDGQTPTAFNSTNSIFVDTPTAITAYVRLYESPSLTKGTHTLVVLSGTPTNASALLYVDFLTIETGSDSASGNIIVDDRDASIKYVGDWRDEGVPWEYMITTKGAPDGVAGGAATFLFNGTSITVFGTTTFSNGPNTTAAISFAIDGGPSSQFHAPQNSGVIEHTSLFHAEGLSNTQEHSIVMTSLNTNSWWLDCIVYTTRNSSIAGGGGGTGPDTGVSGGGGGGGPNVGAVAGGVVAGVVALLAIAGIIFILLRRRKVKSTEVRSQSAGNLDPSFAPFIPPVTGALTPANIPPQKGYDSSGSNPRLAGGDRMGQALLDLSPMTSHSGGTSSTYSSVPPGISQYSDAESQEVLTPIAAGPGPGYGHQSLNNPLYPRFDPGAGGGITSMYQRDSRQDYGQRKGQPFDQKAQFHGNSAAPTVTPAVTTRRGPRPPPSSIPTIEEDSGIRIPARAPPIYTPD